MFVGESSSVIRPDIMLFAILILYSFGSQPVHQAAHVSLLTRVTRAWSIGLPRHRPWLTYRGHAYKNLLTLAVFSPPNQDLREF